MGELRRCDRHPERGRGAPRRQAAVEGACRPAFRSLTIVGGLVWAVAQPYRIVLLDGDGRGLYDYLFQAPLLAIAVGVLFTLAIATGTGRGSRGD